MKKILITGGAGFLGNHLCRKLLENKNNEIHCLDNFYTGYEKNIEDLIGNSRFFLYKENIINLNIDNFNCRFDWVFNLACPASPIQYQKNPVFTWKTSVFGTYNCLELTRLHKARFLQASTSEIYGEPLEHPQKEDLWTHINPIGKRANYDSGKVAAETITMDFHRQFGTDVKIVRIFNSYGPNMDKDDGRVVSNFICQALKNENITIFGEGNQTRSFCYVDDTINGITKMMEKDNFIGPVNIGNPNEFTMKELANLVLELVPESKSKIIYEQLPQDDPSKRCPSINLAQEKLNWSPKVQLKEGLIQTINYFRSILNK